MVFNVILLNDVKSNLKELIRYFEDVKDIRFSVIDNMLDFQEYIDNKKIHLILASSQCREIDPLFVCEMIRATSSLHFLPFLYISKENDFKKVSKAYEIGINESIVAPFNLDELLIRMRSHMINYQTLKKCLVQNERLAIIVATDSLTKVSNRMHLQTILFQSVKEFHRYNRLFSLIYFQINDIQKINSLYGFVKGDKLLKDVAQTVSKSIRESDIIARWTGNNFIVFAPKSTAKDAELLVKKLNSILTKERFIKSYNTRISYGITQVKKEDTIYTAIERANKALLHSIENRLVYSSFL